MKLIRSSLAGLLALAPALLGAATFTTNTTINSGDTTYDGQDIVVSGCTLTVNGPHSFNSLQVISAGILTHTAAASGQPNNQVNLTIAHDVLVDATSRIDVTGKGYHPGFSGPGAGAGLVGTTWNDWAGGGGYGGWGATSSVGLAGGAPYGSITQPTNWGSDGGSCPSHNALGASGGGAVQIVAGGTLTVNGQILAVGAGDATAPNGAGDGEIGGGSGGSIWLTVTTLAGQGTISAQGGNGDTDDDSGGGGGGRIAIYYGTNNFAGAISACSSSISSIIGGAGTIYTKASTQTTGQVLVDNGGSAGAGTGLTSPEAFALTITNGAIGVALAPMTLGSLHIATNGSLTQLAGSGSLTMLVLSNVMIDLGGVFLLDGAGYPIGTNLGPGMASNNPSYYAGGAGYGGLGGSAWGGSPGGPAYGSIMQPVDLGSAGATGNGQPGSAGGGALQLTVNGALTVNGILSANGGSWSVSEYHGGCGSGGSLWLNVGALQGGGVISANGGSSAPDGNGGAGSGGRIAIYYTNAPGFNFASQVTALGGGPFNWTNDNEIGGGAGTIYTRAAAATVGNVLIANGGNSGTLTPLTSPEVYNLTITNNGAVMPSNGLTVSSLQVATNSYITGQAGYAGLNVVVLGNALVASGGSLNADGQGYPIGTNLGPGVAPAVPNYYAGGAGYGGAGGMGWGGAAGGPTYGSLTQPLALGSAGGTGNGQPGTAGGGLVQFTVDGTLTLNGAISASGVYNPGGYGGAGSGGSVWITAGTLQGTGTISANGGSTSPSDDGGGGGGGRIAVYYTQLNGFNLANQLSAAGGGPFDTYDLNGSAGTVYTSSVTVAPAILSATPNGGAARPLASQVDLVFNVAINPATFTAADVTVTTPSGAIPAAQITVSNTGGTSWRIGFPNQTANGHYQYQIGPALANLFGAQMAAAYSGSFDISQTGWPGVIQTSRTGRSLVCAIPSLAGMNYQLLESTDLVNWQAAGTALAGDGTTLVWNLSISGTAGFYRIQVSETP
ncbi:MAG: hypothetical protein ABSC18_08075 [Verrucomicrobiota bacterium]|jgi:hypothetical protein